MASVFENFQPLAAIATTPTGAQILQPLCQTTGATLWVPNSLSTLEQVAVYKGSLKDHIASLWPNHRALVFCLAAGAAVRLIAPLLTDKSSDPAVVVVDQGGGFVISLCSGHQGGADQLTRLIASQLDSTPILTGAAADLGLPGVDVLGIPFGWYRGKGDWTRVSAVVARGEIVQVIQEAGSTLWQAHLRDGHPFYFGFPEDSATSESESISPKARIWISPTHQQFSPESDLPNVQWYPRVMWVGIGCERGTSKQLIEMAIRQTCEGYGLSENAIAGIATIDRKADEVGIVQLCQERHWPLRTFPADVLRSVTVPNPSDVVAAEVGTPSVAEAAALCGARGLKVSKLFAKRGLLAKVSKLKVEGSNLQATNLQATNLQPLLVPKQIVKSANQPGAVTVAIAQSPVEYTGRMGKLLLVGIGPGNLDQITPAAKTAISSADAVIGYSLYINLISTLRRPGQIIEALPITQETQRAKRAIELAEWGLTVAVVSSGDCGIYGMAGLVLEELRSRGWDGKTPQVQVFPGITALQAAASRVGAPLMHDFCAISLSDLLTPWPVIEKRLEASAAADFVTALYNPRSRNRTEQIAIAQRIFLKHRKPDTPVAIVVSAYRDDENITLTTLDKMLEIPIDMLTMVLIGNQSTDIHQDWMITPRGYQI
ncbi:precorrin-3 methyltransferase [Moorena producens 3L]|uniref:Precorrin-3 methyltransferase n=5 Tax=Moorena TaxID=1155738 RepID=F4XTE7_9CYAN|nr:MULTISPECIES: precorrin-3B C(17)-methyltransferase [unclassified Moorena]EGJ32083.1 precorrin-3 methyltransferase [Moorena producens 3L]